jgi:hypothetical protein
MEQPPPPSDEEGGKRATVSFAVNDEEAGVTDDDGQLKRRAMAGQWRTPPTPAFPSINLDDPVVVAPDRHSIVVVPPPPEAVGSVTDTTTVPGSQEAYAAALREAYRRGAEAAAQALQRARVPSNPDLVEPAPVTSSLIHYQHAPPEPAPAATVPPLPQHSQQQQQQLQANFQAAVSSSSTTTQAAAVSFSAPPPVAATTAAAPPAAAAATTINQQQQQRSLSLPDMATYAAKQEEEKRQKRLARNRASARLRRLRKKNLVDAYEQEVRILEKTLQQLTDFDWSAEQPPVALLEALSMDRGQSPVLTHEERRQAAQDILDQQLQVVAMLQDSLLEQSLLGQVAQAQLQGTTDGEWADLQQSLQLTTDQCHELVAQQVGWEAEWTALQTVQVSLCAMREYDWLHNAAANIAADTVLSILNPMQTSKLALWADHNAEAILELDLVQAATSTAAAPIFTFGLESTPESVAGES